MPLATAWQENCFRQFHINNKATTDLLSSNRTSVGVLQVNEQTWHVVYNFQQLRKSINDNSQTGCEIMELYSRDYLQEYPRTFIDTTGLSFPCDMAIRPL